MPDTTAKPGPLDPDPNTLPYPQPPTPPAEAEPAPPVAEPQQPPTQPERHETRPVRPRPAAPAPAPVEPVQTPQPEPKVETPAPPVATPRVGPLLSPADQRAYNDALVSALTATAENLREADRRRGSLNARQRAMVAQARNFMRQAEELRGSDLIAATSLADRAMQVSRELVSTLR